MQKKSSAAFRKTLLYWGLGFLALALVALPFIQSSNYRLGLNKAENTSAAGSFGATVSLLENGNSQVVSPLIWGGNFTGQNVFNRGDIFYKSSAEFFNTISLPTYQSLGIKSIRYPGGCLADSYNPTTGRVNYQYAGTTINEQAMTIPELIKIADASGAEIIYELNIEKAGRANPCAQTSLKQGTIDEAKFVLQTYGNRIKYYEIGNEQNMMPSYWSATEYTTTSRQYAQALKAINPTIKIGVQGYQTGADQNSPKKAEWQAMLTGLLRDTCGAVPCFDFVSDHTYLSRAYSRVSDVPDATKLYGEFIHDSQKKKTWGRNCPVSDARGIIWSNCGEWFVSPVTPDEEGFRSIDAYTYKRSNGKEYVVYSIILAGGTSGKTIECPVEATYINCGLWGGSFDLSRIRGVGGEAYADAVGYTYTVNGAQRFDQAIISIDGRTGWTRTCPIDVVTGVVWAQCGAYIGSPSPWSDAINLTNTRGVGNEAYSDQKTYVLNQNGVQTLYQSITDISGTRAWSRTCPISNSTGITWTSCAAWAPIDLSNYRGIGGERYDSSAVAIVSISPTALRGGGTNFNGMSAFFPQAEYSSILNNLVSTYKTGLGKDVAVTEWSAAGNQLQVNTLDTVEQGMFAGESLIEFARKGFLMAQFHPLSFIGGDFGADTNKINPTAQAFRATSVFAGTTLLTTNVSSPMRSIPADPGCTWPCLRSAQNIPYVNALAAYSADKSKLYVAITNKHDLDNAVASVSLASLPRTAQSVSIKKLAAGNYQDRAFSETVESVPAGDLLSIPVPKNGISIATITLVSRNRLPEGWLDSVTSPAYNQIRLSGWARDPDDLSRATTVRIYEGSQLLSQSVASNIRSDVGAHAFDITIPNISAGAHTIRAVAIDLTTGAEQALSGSPKSVTVTNPPSTPAPTIAPPSPVTGMNFICNSTGTQATIKWTPSAGASSYNLRADRQTDAWSGVCPLTSTNGGDVCVNGLVTPSYTLSTNPNTQYNIWVHAMSSSGASGATNLLVTCPVTAITPSPTPVPTLVPTPNPTSSPIACINSKSYTLSPGQKWYASQNGFLKPYGLMLQSAKGSAPSYLARYNGTGGYTYKLQTEYAPNWTTNSDYADIMVYNNTSGTTFTVCEPASPVSTPAPVTTIIEAENYTSTGGNIAVAPQETVPGVLKAAGYIYRFDPKDWVKYAGVVLTGKTKIDFRMSPRTSGAKIEIRSASQTGPLLGTLTTSRADSSYTSYTLESAAITPVSGTVDLFLVGVSTYDIGRIERLEIK